MPELMPEVAAEPDVTTQNGSRFALLLKPNNTVKNSGLITAVSSLHACTKVPVTTLIIPDKVPMKTVRYGYAQSVKTYVSGEQMMPATLRRFWLSMLLGTLALAGAGCGGVAKSDVTGLTRGNWSVTAISSNPAIGIFQVGGNLAQSGDVLSGTMYVAGSLCFDISQPMLLTGTVKDQQVTLASADVNGQVFSVVAAETTGSTLNGTYTITGGCGSGDHGTVAANAVPSISGTWSGTVIGSGGPNVTLSVALTQAGNASADGTFALTGSLIYTGSSCSVSGTVTNAFVAGSYILLNGNTEETDGSVGTFSYNNVTLGDSRHPTNMTGTYEVYDGLCAYDIQALALRK
jgi:hypothetical protein